MKILFLSHYGAMLGANRSLLSLVMGVKAKGVEVLVYCPKEGPFAERLREENIPVEIVSYKNWANTYLLPGFWLLPLRFFQNKRQLPTLAEKVKSFQPDIIHTNSSALGIGAQLAEKLQVPHVWHIREFGRLDYNLRFFPSINSLHNSLAKATKIIAISEVIKKEVIGGKNLPVELVFNGVAPATHFQNFTPNYERYKKNETITFLLIGMLHPNKGQLMGLQGFNRIAIKYPQARLLIVGAGRRLYERKLKHFCKSNNIESQVHFAGYIPKPKEAYLQSDVVLMCSKNEAMGRVTAEAMAYGKPVIGYKGGATPELVEHGHDGFLFSEDDKGLAKYMQHFLDKPEELRRMGENSFASAKEKYTIDRYVDKMYDIFAEIIKD